MSSRVRGREQGGARGRGLIKACGFKEGPESTRALEARLSDLGLKPASLAV